MNIRLISFFLSVSVSVPLVFTVSSCSQNQVDDSIKDIDGYDWVGREYGLFKENDYIIDKTNKTVTYINGRKYYGTDIVIPDYVWFNKEKYKVLLGPGCFKNNRFIMGKITFNIHTTFIPEECFYGCWTLERLAFKNFITSFEKYAFYSCKLLDYIVSDTIYLSQVHYFKDYCFYDTCLNSEFVFGSELKEIGAHAFSGASGIKFLDLSHNTLFSKISDYAFCNCEALNKVILPPNFKEIGSHTFLGCSMLKSVVLPTSNMEIAIGDYAFYDCKVFTGFSRKCTFTKIGNYCFSGCVQYALDNNSLKNSKLTQIGNQAFAQCCNSVIVIPKNIKFIHRYAFFKNTGSIGKLCIIDFSDYTKDDQIPILCGTNIFYDSAERGTVYLNKSANLLDWKDELKNKGLDFKSLNWTISIK